MDKGFNICDFLTTEIMTEEMIKYSEFWVNANRVVRELDTHNFAKEKILVNDCIDFGYLEQALQGYDDKNILDFLKYGFPLNAINTDINEEIPSNQKGARENPEELEKYIAEEHKMGSIIGPFITSPFGNVTRISPLDTRDKKESSEKRVIQNLSYPYRGGSVNASISKEEYVDGPMNLTYPTVDDLAKIIRKKGKKSKMFKRDLKK